MRVIICLILIFFLPGWGSALAQTGVVDLSPWQGEFISRKCIIDRDTLADLYEKTAVEAAKLGKSYSAADVKQALKTLFHTDFDRLVIRQGLIGFYAAPPGADPVLLRQHRYRFEGRVKDRFGDMVFEWYAFRTEEESLDPYAYVVLLKLNSRNGGEPHFHIRYGNKGFDTLVNDPAMAAWWPCMLREDFNLDRFRAGFSPEEMAGLLP